MGSLVVSASFLVLISFISTVFFFLIYIYLLTFALVLGGWFGYVWFGVFSFWYFV